MLREEEKDELNLSTRPISQATQQGQQMQAGSASDNVPFGYENRVRHVYLQQQNSYGRFVPFLLLKDKLHSQIDSSGTSALAHMCSHNSPYIPLYLSSLKKDDPILNRATNMGHTPLDIAGMYCRREYVDLLREKGAIDDGRVDNWAIQGANIANWSGNVDPAKKQLIHWAAYNNFPDVLSRYHQSGANVNQSDERGNTPIDMAVLNKCYESVEVLARLGYRPRPQALQKAQSPYINKFLANLDRSSTSRLLQQSLKLSLIPILIFFQFLLADVNIYIHLVTICVFLYLAIKIPGRDSQIRPTQFFSSLVNRRIVYGYNHFMYVFLMMLLVVSGFAVILSLEVQSFWIALYFWGNLGITLTFLVNLGTLVYGVLTNTTPSQMFESHLNPQLWKKIDYFPHRNMVMRVYKNQNRKDPKSNLQYYFSYRPQ